MSRKSRGFNRVLMALIFLFLYAPIFVLIVFSFNDSSSRTVWQGFTLRWYEELVRDRAITSALWTTLLVSLLATVIATAAGTMAAVGLFHMKKRWRRPLMTVNSIPMTNADIVTGVSLCLLFVAFFAGWADFARWINAVQGLVRLPVRLHMGFGTLLIAHITFNIPYVILNVSPKLRQMDKNLVDAAQDLGCTWLQAIVSGALIAFTMSVDDFVISYFTAGSGTSTLAMVVYGMTKRRISPKINAVSTLLFITVLALLVVVNVREARQEQLADQRKL